MCGVKNLLLYAASVALWDVLFLFTDLKEDQDYINDATTQISSNFVLFRITEILHLRSSVFTGCFS